MNFIFIGCQGLQAHGSPGMELLGTDTDFRPKSKLKSIRKAGTGIDIDAGRINFPKEPIRVLLRFCNNGLRMMGCKAINMSYALV